ncbi:hypothetical protein C8J57DRAFT_1615974 [Mycena rebaudengoi]|nr:hypothetical protein C8J57DRAFT_1615974 [Mycena rebaudengoi]
MSLCSHCGHFCALRVSLCAPHPDHPLAEHPRDRLAGVMDEIAALVGHLERLRAERDVIQAELDEIVYPVLTLPPEVTSEIFCWCLPSTPDFPQPDPAAPPLVLLAICRRWRSIALAIPQLWSRLEIRLGPSITRNESLCLLLERWLSRSASHPLSILLDDTESARSTSTSFYNTVVPHAHHLQHLHLILEHEHLVRYLDNFNGGYPLLETVNFSASEAGLYTLSLAAFQASPRLLSVDADAETLHPFPLYLPLWSQLTRFVGRNMSIAQGWLALTRMSSLEEFFLILVGSPSTNLIAGLAPTTLPRLRCLKVFQEGELLCNPSDVTPFLRFLTLPALTELTFSTDDDHISHFLDFMARSSCHLISLVVDCSLSTANFAQLFAAIPRLFKLTADIPVRSFGDVSSILATRNGHLPALRELIIRFPVPPPTGNGDSSLHYPLLIDMLQSRSEGGASAGITPLKVFELHRSESHLDFLASFDALEQKGMQITFEP